MREQKPDEPRIEYLARVLHEFMNNSIAAEITVFYDDAQCDGMCLAYDFMAELGINLDDEME